LHIKSVHFSFLSWGYSILLVGGVSFGKHKWFMQGYRTVHCCESLMPWVFVHFSSVIIHDCAVHVLHALRAKGWKPCLMPAGN